MIRMTTKLFFGFLFLYLTIPPGFGQDYLASDAAIDLPRPYTPEENKAYSSITIETHYVSMRDGIQIAVDVYRPKGLDEGIKLPAILFQTRYWRSIGFYWPISMFYDRLDFNGAGKGYIEALVKNGYAFVSVDVRGSGASTGTWTQPFSDAEIRDGAEIINWIIEQSWSNGIIGTFGRSYSGSAAEFNLINQHPAIKAAMPMYTPYDVYDDIGFPGGIHNEWYTRQWGNTNQLLDQNTVPIDDWKARTFVTGVSHVRGSRKTLKLAIENHKLNVDIDKESHKIKFRDDPINPNVEHIDTFSPFTFSKEINDSNVPMYSYSGWMDGGYQHAAIKRFLNSTHSQKKLTIGPWDHMGKHNVSPANPGKSGFDHISEVLKFFDFHLKGIENGIDKEPPIHYFTMIEEKWKSTFEWPPPNSAYDTMFLESSEGLSHILQNEERSIPLKIDSTIGTGTNTRWEATATDGGLPPFYANRASKDSSLLHFTSIPLTRDLEVTGHPILTIFASSSSNDFGLIAYLEDVSESGEVNHVTVGHFRAIHRKIADSPLYKDVVPQHSYRKEDAQFLKPGQPTELTFDLLPTSYLFRKGHRIRLVIVDRDKDHFKNLNPELKAIDIHVGGKWKSFLELPIIKNK